MQESGHALPPYVLRHCRELGSILESANQASVSIRLSNQPPSPGFFQPVNPGLQSQSPSAPSGPQYRQRPTFGQAPRASSFGPEQQYHSKSLLAGRQQRPTGGGDQQYSQQLGRNQFSQQMYTQPQIFSGQPGGCRPICASAAGSEQRSKPATRALSVIQPAHRLLLAAAPSSVLPPKRPIWSQRVQPERQAMPSPANQRPTPLHKFPKPCKPCKPRKPFKPSKPWTPSKTLQTPPPKPPPSRL